MRDESEHESVESEKESVGEASLSWHDNRVGPIDPARLDEDQQFEDENYFYEEAEISPKVIHKLGKEIGLGDSVSNIDERSQLFSGREMPI